MCNSAKMQAQIGRLMVVHYINGTTMTREIPLSYMPTTEVQVDHENGVWYYRRGTEHEAQFTIGVAVRVPEGKEFYGPMMVYDPTVAEQRRAVEMNQQMLEEGTLIP